MWLLESLPTAPFVATVVRVDGQRCDGALALDLLDDAGSVLDGAVSGGDDDCPRLVVSEAPGTYALRVSSASSPVAAAYLLNVDFGP